MILILTSAIASAEPCDLQTLRSELTAAEAWSLDAAMFSSVWKAERSVECLDETLTPKDVARLYRAMGVASISAGGEGLRDEAVRWFELAMTVDPGLEQAEAGPWGWGAGAWAAARDLAPRQSDRNPLPQVAPGTLVLIDGKASTGYPVGRPYVLQVLVATDVVESRIIVDGSPVPWSLPEPANDWEGPVEEAANARRRRAMTPEAMQAGAQRTVNELRTAVDALEVPTGGTEDETCRLTHLTSMRALSAVAEASSHDLEAAVAANEQAAGDFAFRKVVMASTRARAVAASAASCEQREEASARPPRAVGFGMYLAVGAATIVGDPIDLPALGLVEPRIKVLMPVEVGLTSHGRHTFGRLAAVAAPVVGGRLLYSARTWHEVPAASGASVVLGGVAGRLGIGASAGLLLPSRLVAQAVFQLQVGRLTFVEVRGGPAYTTWRTIEPVLGTYLTFAAY